MGVVHTEDATRARSGDSSATRSPTQGSTKRKRQNGRQAGSDPSTIAGLACAVASSAPRPLRSGGVLPGFAGAGIHSTPAGLCIIGKGSGVGVELKGFSWQRMIEAVEAVRARALRATAALDSAGFVPGEVMNAVCFLDA